MLEPILEHMRADQLTIIGSPMSPYVRKVLAAILHKDIAFKNIPFIPWLKEEDMSPLHPMSRIPVLVDGDFILPDSSVIVQYLEETFPGAPLIPADRKLAARARWYEEYADTKLFTCLAVNIFFETFAKPKMLRIEPNHEAVEQNLKVELPDALDYLEKQVPETGFILDTVSIADISLASPFRNAFVAGWAIDADRWPKTASYVSRVLSLDMFENLTRLETVLLTVPYKATPEIVDRHFAP